MAGSPARAIVFDSRALDRLTTEQLRDAVAYADPDVLLATTSGARFRVRSTLPDAADLPTLAPDQREGDEPAVHRIGDVTLVAAADHDTLERLPALVASGRVDPETAPYVLTDRLSLDVRPTALHTSLSGLEAYRDALERGPPDDAGAIDDSFTHLSTGLPLGYRREWDGHSVRGIAPEETCSRGLGADQSGAVTIPILVLGPDGTVATSTIRGGSLGLRAIRGVGESRAGTLRTAGYRSPEAVAAADLPALAALSGFGRESAARLRDRASAFVDGEVRRSDDGRLPDREPVFVDVETDGLSPSIVWLIGVLARTPGQPNDERGSRSSDPAAGDGAASNDGAGGGQYLSFLNRKPDDPGRALEAFLSWYVANAADRPIVAYNGHAFDVPVLEAQIERHCPRYLDDWREAWTFDPYEWAVHEEHAVLPGRTNRLEDVAAALGYDADGADDPQQVETLSGAVVARQYRRWMDGEGDEPDWDRLEAYCEADVRALAHVYDALAAAERTASADDAASRTGDDTTQGRLGDF